MIGFYIALEEAACQIGASLTELPRHLRQTLEKQSSDFEVYLPIIKCRDSTPTPHRELQYELPHTAKGRLKEQPFFSVKLYAADPLWETFVYIGGRQVR